MSEIVYKIVEHDGGWAYTVDGVFSETFGTHDEALDAARRAVAEQKLPDETHAIRYQDGKGGWHTEVSRGDDRPAASVEG